MGSTSWRLTKSFKFEAAHLLPDHDGKCARLHGHSWQATVVCEGAGLEQSGPKAGMIIDYGDMSRVVRPIVDEFLDHHYLNTTLGMRSPTSELIAQWLYRKCQERGLAGLVMVRVDETCTTSCEYREVSAIHGGPRLSSPVTGGFPE